MVYHLSKKLSKKLWYTIYLQSYLKRAPTAIVVNAVTPFCIIAREREKERKRVREAFFISQPYFLLSIQNQYIYASIL